MAENLTTSVRRKIDRLKKQIDERTSELASLKDELIRHQKESPELRRRRKGKNNEKILPRLV
jgi:cell division septum initiation protein DivIVA